MKVPKTKAIQVRAFHQVQLEVGWSTAHLSPDEAVVLAEQLLEAAADVENGKGADNAWWAENRSGLWREA